ncbi:MAG: response regulator transcription factor [Gemmatimonadetes bacterium]|nr:response regulator transcription factor [Gemmatimonadota bacterium]
MRPLRALIVDDEPLARRALRLLLADEPSVVCVGEARDATEALELLKKLEPELIFLDIHLPGASGFDVLERSQTDARVIFTTAYEEYALAAFELGAIDYLRKPFGSERLHLAIERAGLQAVAARQATAAGVSLGERIAFAETGTRPLSRIFVRDEGSVRPVHCNDIVRCEANGDYVVVHAHGRRFPVYLNLGDLADQMDAERFVRVHRSHLVNLDHVASLTTHDASRVAILMKDGSQVIASRAGTQLLRRRYHPLSPS